MNDGTQKPVEKITVGDFFKTSYGFSKGEEITVSTPKYKMLRITSAAGNSLLLTAHHLIFIRSKGFVQAAEVKFGDVISTARGESNATSILN